MAAFSEDGRRGPDLDCLLDDGEVVFAARRQKFLPGLSTSDQLRLGEPVTGLASLNVPALRRPRFGIVVLEYAGCAG